MMYTSIKDIDEHLASIRKAQDDLKKEALKLRENKIRLQQLGKDLVVSDHAIVRYIERIGGMSMKAMQDKVKDGSGALPDGAHNMEGHVIVVKDNVVVTVKEI